MYFINRHRHYLKKHFLVKALNGLATTITKIALFHTFRKGNEPNKNLVVVCNFTPSVHENYKIGLPVNGKLVEIFNSDSKEFGGSGVSNKKEITIKKQPWNGKEYAAEILVAPLAVTVFQFKP